MGYFYAILISEAFMSEVMLFIVFGIIAVGFFIFVSKQQQDSAAKKNVMSDKINAMLELSPNEFASKFIAKK